MRIVDIFASKNKHKCENKGTISSKNTFPLGKARRFVHTPKDLQERKNLLAWTKRGGGWGVSKSQNGILSMQDKICSQPSNYNEFKLHASIFTLDHFY
jgi:hypothetical protein